MRANRLVSKAQQLICDSGFHWVHDPELWVELFVMANLAILAADIYIAHSVNHFKRAAEYIPLYFSLAAPLVLAICVLLRWAKLFSSPWRDIGYFVGWLSILIGLGGVLYHLESRFFLDRTLKSLTYAAPFAAPLAYTGIGFLILVNRMVNARSVEWARWIILLAMGGFFGNFVCRGGEDEFPTGFFGQLYHCLGETVGKLDSFPIIEI